MRRRETNFLSHPPQSVGQITLANGLAFVDPFSRVTVRSATTNIIERIDPSKVRFAYSNRHRFTKIDMPT